jgi:AAA domain
MSPSEPELGAIIRGARRKAHEAQQRQERKKLNGAAGSDQHDEPKRRFPLVPFSEIQVSRSAAYLVRNILPREGLVVVWGPPGCGKSFWVLDLVLHVALERKYREHRTKQGDVCYVACEGERGLNNRVAAWRQHNEVQAAPFWLVTTQLDLVAERALLVSDIREQIGEGTRPSVIVLDTLNRSLNGSESSDEDMAAYIRAAEYVRVAFHCLVIVIHHCGLDTTRPRGHTSLKGASDAQIAITNTGQAVIATVERMKDGLAGTIVASALEVIDLGHDEDGEPVTSCAIKPAEVSERDLPRNGKARPSGDAGIGLDVLMNVTVTEGETLPTTDGFPSSPTKGVTVTAWRREFYPRLGDKDAAAKRQAYNRMSSRLQADKHITILDERVWCCTRPTVTP